MKTTKFCILLLILMISPISFYAQRSTGQPNTLLKTTMRDKIRLWAMLRTSNENIEVYKSQDFINAKFDSDVFSKSITVQILDMENNVKYERRINRNVKPEWKLDLRFLKEGSYTIVFYSSKSGKLIGFFDK